MHLQHANGAVDALLESLPDVNEVIMVTRARRSRRAEGSCAIRVPYAADFGVRLRGTTSEKR
jgi:hypothetical protein